MSYPGQGYPQHQIMVHLPGFQGTGAESYAAAPMPYQQERYLMTRPVRREAEPAPTQEELYEEIGENYINPSQNVDRLAPLGSWNKPPPVWPPRRSVPISKTGSTLKKTTESASVLNVAQRISASSRSAPVRRSRPVMLSGSGALRPTPTQLMSMMSGRSTPTRSGRSGLSQTRSSMSGRSTPTQLLASMSGRSTPTQLLLPPSGSGRYTPTQILTGTQSPTQILTGTQSPTQPLWAAAAPASASAIGRGRRSRSRKAMRCLYDMPSSASQPQMMMPEYLDRRITASQGEVHRIR